MTKKTKRDDEMRSHYDFADGVRGKYAARYAEGKNIVALAPDLAADDDFQTLARTSDKSGNLKDVRKK